MGAHLTALGIEQQSSPLPPDLKRARTAGRLYAELFDATGDEDYCRRREFFSMLIGELEADGTAVEFAQI